MENQVSSGTPLIRVIFFLLNFAIPQIFGILPCAYDLKNVCLIPSRKWNCFCGIFGIFFGIVYPLAVLEIMAKRTIRDDDINGISSLIEKLRYIALYLFSLSVYIRLTFYAATQAAYVNGGISFYDRCNKLCGDNVGVKKFLIPYFCRVIYSYVVYAGLNYVSLAYYYGDLSSVNILYKFIYFVPDIVMTSTNVRSHSSILMQTVCCRRINLAFTRCIDSVNKSRNKTHMEQMEACNEASDKFESLTLYQAELIGYARITENILAIIMIFLILNSIMNLTSTVNI